MMKSHVWCRKNVYIGYIVIGSHYPTVVNGLYCGRMIVCVENITVQKLKYGNRSTEVRRKATYHCLLPY